MLIDEILEEHRNPKMDTNFHELPNDFWVQFFDKEKPQVFKVDNVCEYMETKKNEWGWHDFPNIAPVYRSTWFEWKLSHDTKQTMGVLASTAECRSVEEATIALRDIKMSLFFKSGLYSNNEIAESTSKMMDVPPERLRWIVQMTMFNRFDVGRFSAYMGNVFILVDHNGETFINDNDTMQGIFTRPSNALMEFLKDRKSDGRPSSFVFVQSLCGVPCMSLSFLHAKGIKEQAAPPIPDALQKARIKRGRLPLFRHYVLALDVPKRIIRDGNQGSDDLSPQALHLVRGHFKHFDDKPLFGKYKGTWFWHPAVKGNKGYGEVTKDYEIRTPRS